MNRIFKLEIKRAFRNRLFAAALCVAFAICVWHFMEMCGYGGCIFTPTRIHCLHMRNG